MKAYRIKKRTSSFPTLIQEIRAPLRKPRLPHVMVFRINKPKVYVEFVFKAMVAQVPELQPN